MQFEQSIASIPKLPEKILNHPKQGFAAPFSYWFQGEMKTYIREVLSDRRVVGRGLFNQAAVDNLLIVIGNHS